MAADQAPLSLGFSRQEHWSGLPFPSMHESEKWKWSHSVTSDSLRPHGLQPTRPLYPWDFPGKSTGVGCHCFLWKSSLRHTNKWKKHDAEQYVGFCLRKEKIRIYIDSTCICIRKVKRYNRNSYKYVITWGEKNKVDRNGAVRVRTFTVYLFSVLWLTLSFWE